MVEGEAKSERSIFVEHQRAFQLISALNAEGTTPASMDATLGELRIIFDKYLEIPSLLDQYLENMVVRLSKSARLQMDETSTIGREGFWVMSLPRELSTLYALSKVRGYKRVQRFLSHEVRDIGAVLKTLTDLDSFSHEERASLDSSMSGHPQLWESIVVLWNWLGMLSLIPFDSTIIVESKSVDDLVLLAKKYLSEAGPTREMAAACLASWLSRSDLEQTHLESFVSWSLEVINDFMKDKKNVFRVLGVLQTMVTILKHSKADREKLLALAMRFRESILRLSEASISNILLRKYIVKFWTRSGTVCMPPRIAGWRYQRGSRSLKENLALTSQSAFVTSGDEKIRIKNEQPTLGDEEVFFLVPDEVEQAMGEVLAALTDQSTVVRWSAAKGVGRITERLPGVCGEDVMDAVLKLFDDREKENSWHGACLSLAELSRRGLLLPHRLEEVMPRIVEAIHYDIPRRQTSVGAHVRDAACYTYWAIARAYSPDVLKPFLLSMSQAVVTSFLFDREVNCRRAASAAFQELVGRQGAANFKHGITILTVADYFSLGNRSDSYLSIAAEIAGYDDYRECIIEHLYTTKISHWDPLIRKLSSEAIGGLTVLDVQCVVRKVLPFLLEHSLDERNVQVRHGCVLGMAEVVLAIGKLKRQAGTFESLLSKENLLAIAELVPTIEKKRLYRGKGGEQMRDAVCRLIECISIAEIPLTVPQQVRLLDSIDSCIPHPNDVIQQQATMALSALMRSYFPVSAKGPSDRLQKRVVNKYVTQVKTNINPAATRGFTLALGRLPAKLLAPSSKVLDLSLACLCRVSRPDATIGNDKDAETRRNALLSLGRICATVGLLSKTADSTECVVGISPKQCGHVFTALFRGLNDYNVDRRGDIGSLCRIAAIEGLVNLVQTITSTPDIVMEDYFSPETCTRLIGGLLKQLAEKLDAVRYEAGAALEKVLLSEDPTIPFIAEKQFLKKSLKIGQDNKTNHHHNWGDATTTFPLLVHVLEIDVYFAHVVSGLVISVCGLTQSVAEQASRAFISWVKGATKEQIQRLGEVLLDLFEKHLHQGRVILPLLKTIALLMDRMCAEDLIRDSEFASTLLRNLQLEESTCKDVHRLSAVVDVTLGLLGTESDEQDASKEVLSFATKLLMHPYPRVRRITAEKVYVRLLELPRFADNDEALSLLLEQPWDSTDSTASPESMALKVAQALGVALPQSSDNSS